MLAKDLSLSLRSGTKTNQTILVGMKIVLQLMSLGIMDGMMVYAQQENMLYANGEQSIHCVRLDYSFCIN